MHRKFQFFMFVFLLATFYLAADEVPVKSKINEVTVFTQGAQVFRTATQQLQPGEHLVVFPGLSAHLNGGSIQMGGKGSLTILSVSHRMNYMDVPNKAEKEQLLSDKMKAVNAKMQEVNALIQVYNEEESLLLSNKNLGGQQNGVNIDQLKQAAAFYRTRLTEIKTKKIELSTELAKLKDEYNRLHRELSQITNSRGISTAEILVKVDVEKTTTAKFQFSYTVQNAGWQPYYDIRMENVNKPISLEYKAKVSQRTGVDWNNVVLILSSGNPNKNNVLPQINPWYVDFSPQHVNYRGARGGNDGYYQTLPEATDEEVADFSVATSKERTMKTPTAMVVQKVTNFEYAIANRYTIKSSTLEEDVAVQTIALEALFEYHANTKLDETAYLMAKLFNWHNYNLLNGQAKLFNQGTFVGETFLNVESTSDTLLLSMGRDDNIVIKRERVADMNGSQVIGDKKKLTRFWTVSVRNSKSQAIQLVVTDQIPLSRQKQITVKREAAEGAEYNENTGYLKWRMNLPPATTKELKFGYSVKHPKDLDIVLND